MSTSTLNESDADPARETTVRDDSERIRIWLTHAFAEPPESLGELLDRASELAVDDRLTLVEQALILFRDLYVNRPLKEALHAVRPVRRLELLHIELARLRRRECRRGEALRPEELPPPLRFHNELTEIFMSVRDLHMRYLMPEPFRDCFAVLGFDVENYYEPAPDDLSRDVRQLHPVLAPDGRRLVRRYLVTGVVTGSLDGGHFRPGVEVVSWNGMDIGDAVERNGDRHAGSNAAAHHARGLTRLTLRPLWVAPPPDEKWVIVGYRIRPAGEMRYMKLDWWFVHCRHRTFRGSRVVGSIHVPRTPRTIDLGESVDAEADAMNEVRQGLEARCTYRDFWREIAARSAGTEFELEEIRLGNTRRPEWGHSWVFGLDGKSYGYLRIYTFAVHVETFLEEVRSLLVEQQRTRCLRGLILDLRDNGGGRIAAGERLLRMLSPHPVEPIRFEFLNTPACLELTHRLRGRGLGPWERSLERVAEIGSTYSRGFPITPPESLGGQVFRGPVVLIVNALSYSTTDIFAAGFEDHGIGRILSTDGNVGAGGANTVSHETLRRFAGGELGLKRLPRGAGMKVAIRRAIRVGEQVGTPLEALGIEIDDDSRYYLQDFDLLELSRGLLEKAVGILETMK